MKIHSRQLILFILGLLFVMPLGFAYIDPGTGGYLLQAMWQYVVAMFAFASAFVIHFFRFTLKNWFKKPAVKYGSISLSFLLIFIGLVFWILPHMATTAMQDVDDFDPDVVGVIYHNPELAYNGYSLYEGKLIDMDGNLVNEWTRGIYLGYIASDGYYYAQHCFECLTWGKYTWDGEVVWELDIPIHHEIIESPWGTIFTTGKTVHDYNGRNVEFDTILEFDTDGNLLREFSLWDNFQEFKKFHAPLELDKPRNALLADNTRKDVTSIWGGNYDYYHLNSISFVPLTPYYGMHPAFNPGNWIISFRHGSMVFILDNETQQIHWTGIHNQVPGTLDGQHTPFMLENGNIIIMDNGRGRGWSRVIELNPVTMQLEWEYVADPKEDFFTMSQGMAQPLTNGNFLITESEPGRVFEITRDGELVWDFYHPEAQGPHNSAVEELWGKRQQIYRMTRYSADFIEQFLE